jgi:hypothetical protein
LFVASFLLQLLLQLLLLLLFWGCAFVKSPLRGDIKVRACTLSDTLYSQSNRTGLSLSPLFHTIFTAHSLFRFVLHQPVSGALRILVDSGEGAEGSVKQRFLNLCSIDRVVTLFGASNVLVISDQADVCVCGM